MVEKMEPCQTKVGWGRCKGTDFSISKKVFTEKSIVCEITCNKCKEVTTVSMNPALLIEDGIAQEWNGIQADKVEA